MRFLLEWLHGARLEGGGVCGLWVGKGAGEGRQGTQDIEKDNGLKKEDRCRCTGTPTLGLPPVFSGPVAVFMSCVYAVFDPMIYMLIHCGYCSNYTTNSRTHGVGRRRRRLQAGRKPAYQTERLGKGVVPVQSA